MSVARWVCGAPAKVLGENTMTKLMPSVCHSTLRRLAMRAVMLRPSTLTVMRVAELQPEAVGDPRSNETSGWPG